MKLKDSFFTQDVLDLAPALLGKILVRKYSDNSTERFIITETEAYRGEEDLACHASKGRTSRAEIMYKDGGHIYIYLIYGMYWMFNIVANNKEIPQAVLIRGIENYNGPGKLTKRLKIDKSLNSKHINYCESIWIEDSDIKYKILKDKRIGIDYAGEIWKNKKWRFFINL